MVRCSKSDYITPITAIISTNAEDFPNQLVLHNVTMERFKSECKA